MGSLHQDMSPDVTQPAHAERHVALHYFVRRRFAYLSSSVAGIILIASLFFPWANTDTLGCYFTHDSGTCAIEKYTISPSAGPYSLFDFTNTQPELHQITVHYLDEGSSSSDHTFELTFPDGEKYYINYTLQIRPILFWGAFLCALLLVVLPVAWLIRRRGPSWDYAWIVGFLLGSLVGDAIFLVASADPFKGVGKHILSQMMVLTVLTLPPGFGFWVATSVALVALVMVMVVRWWEIRYLVSSGATSSWVRWRFLGSMAGVLLVVLLIARFTQNVYARIDEPTLPQPTATATPAPLRATCFTLSLHPSDPNATTCDTVSQVTKVPLNTPYYLTSCYPTDVPLPSATAIVTSAQNDAAGYSEWEITPGRLCFVDSGEFINAGVYTSKLYWHPPPIEHFPHLPDAPGGTERLWQLQMQIRFEVG